MTSKQLETIKSRGNMHQLLVASREKLADYLGHGVDVDHYIAGVIEECERNPNLYSCTVPSVFASVRKAAINGLPLGVDLCYLVPYARECSFQVGYRGLLFLARQSGAILRHVVRSVHDGDGFAFDDGLNPWVKHTQSMDDRVWENLTHVYAHFALPNRQEHLEVMSKAAVEKHRDQYTKAKGKDSPWQTNPISMAKKTVIRRAFAGDQIPISSDLRKIVISDEINEVIDGQVVSNDEPSAEEQEAIRQQELKEAGELFPTHEQTT